MAMKMEISSLTDGQGGSVECSIGLPGAVMPNHLSDQLAESWQGGSLE